MEMTSAYHLIDAYWKVGCILKRSSERENNKRRITVSFKKLPRLVFLNNDKTYGNQFF